MPLIVTERHSAWIVRSYAPGLVQLGCADRTEHCSTPLLLVPGSGPRPLTASTAEALAEEDIAAVLALGPQVALLGTPTGSPLSHLATRRRLLERGIGLEVMTLGAACRTYNLLVQDERPVIALVFP